MIKELKRDTCHVDNEVYLTVPNKEIELLFIPLISCQIDFIFLFCPADNELIADIQKERIGLRLVYGILIVTSLIFLLSCLHADSCTRLQYDCFLSCIPYKIDSLILEKWDYNNIVQIALSLLVVHSFHHKTQ